MIKAILGTKISQSQGFTSDGERIPITRIMVGPCWVIDIKRKEKAGYDAICLGLGEKRINLVNKPIMGILKKAGLEKNPPRFFREIRVRDNNVFEEGKYKVGEKLKVTDIFSVGDDVVVTGTSKGKGFQGVVKRHHFRGGPRTHGQSDRERAPGSIGQTTTPGRVYKGKRMAGRMGGNKIAVKGLKVVSMDTENNIMTLRGLVPGYRNSLLIIKER